MAIRGCPHRDDEVAYLCEQASRYFTHPVHPSDVVWSYAGVRPLLDDASGDPSAVTRDYLLESNGEAAPLLSVWGGKITTFRKLAEEAADEIGRMLGESRSAWTEGASLPGGDLGSWIGQLRRPDTDFERFIRAVLSRHPWLDAVLARRLARAYGSRIAQVLGGASSRADLGDEGRLACSRSNCATCGARNGRTGMCCGGAPNEACTAVKLASTRPRVEEPD